ncbi:metal-sulfur cluster assembly factor [Mesorhizobium sp.]|uniref:metal-sulfur cluster assembly factor n=1 Tax=Mesorhizobium sp. TaxID=1871066 RepID=UPI000FE85C6F|nr:metal-sulfur cluster assembly factor [Mesorhizobium sp.]RWM28579.1 MAG: metal-sulfur cluster assembly factor [Mesorhizobium sp.]RWM39457.1 MAG: metal-sulfur cluster assembly factor [Mesorhizobium sp.]TIO76919.1 MAG: metal-sulfur cluster assembly factor [Mesorhizobium sp.]TIO84729.1 MAG: metal-sulfur cluster assembly factor [Mesorhizobium sp.]TJV52512.1 MAG: metal-sulfur cluster assembly factor [Mesorhizobium sp.]
MTYEEDEALTSAARESLRLVIDPELGENVVDLGLIYRLSVSQDGTAHIEMTTTTRACPAADFLKDAVLSAVSQLPEIRDVHVRLTYEPPWVPDMMNADASRRLG